MNEIEIENLAARAIEAEDFAEAQALLEPLAESDSEYALVTLAWMHETKKVVPNDLKLAASLYERATKIGCMEAYNCLGRVLRVQEELVKAREVYKAGAERGNIGSMSWLGTMMLWGWGGPVDVDNAMLWLNKTAEKGHVVAKGQLLILERQRSKSIFRHVVYFFRWILLGLHGYREYSSNPHSGKVF
jgi:uncharacterized protein